MEMGMGMETGIEPQKGSLLECIVHTYTYTLYIVYCIQVMED
jgi:hypothetical protein